PHSIESWVWGIARHVLVEQYRTNRPTQPVEDDLGGPDPSDDDPGFAFGKREALALVGAVVARLGAVQREVITTYLTESLRNRDEVKGERLALVLGAGWTAARVNRELDRARDAVRRGVGVLSVARSARACPRALTLVGPEPGALTAGQWARLARHAHQ